MAEKRPLGVTIVGGIFVFLGGLSTFIIFIEVIDTLNRFGLESIFVVSYTSFKGFMTFALTPVILYSTGLGVLMLRGWSRKLIILFVPIFAVLFFMNETNFGIWLPIIAWVLYYFNQKKIKQIFD